MKSERQGILKTWNQTHTDYPRNACIHELFESRVQQDPTTVAIVFKDQQLTYGQLNERANQLAHWLIQRGIGPGSLVGICMYRSPEVIISMLGILKAGGAYVPLDPGYPAERLSFMVEDTQLPVILTNCSFDASTFEIWGALLSGAKLVVLDQKTVLAPRMLADCLNEEGINVLFLTTALFNLLAKEAPQVLAGIDHLLFDGEAVDPQWVRRVLDEAGPGRLLHVYGPTENTTFTTWHGAFPSCHPGDQPLVRDL